MNGDDPTGSNSLDKIVAIVALCDRLGVSTRAELLGEHGELLSGREKDGKPGSTSLLSAMVKLPSDLVSSTLSSTVAALHALTNAGRPGGHKMPADFGGGCSSDATLDGQNDADGDAPTPGLWIVPLHSW